MNASFDFAIAVFKFVIWFVLTLIGGLIGTSLLAFLVGAVCENLLQIQMHRFGAGGQPEFNGVAGLLMLICTVVVFSSVGSSLWRAFFGKRY